MSIINKINKLVQEDVTSAVETTGNVLKSGWNHLTNTGSSIAGGVGGHLQGSTNQNLAAAGKHVVANKDAYGKVAAAGAAGAAALKAKKVIGNKVSTARQAVGSKISG